MSLELTGPVGRTINVAVECRARVVVDFGDRDPTTTIRLDRWTSRGWPVAA